MKCIPWRKLFGPGGGGGGAGFVPYMGYIGLCGPKWVWFLSDVGLKKDTDVVHLV